VLRDRSVTHYEVLRQMGDDTFLKLMTDYFTANTTTTAVAVLRPVNG
jgi:hypothetical protein